MGADLQYSNVKFFGIFYFYYSFYLKSHKNVWYSQTIAFRSMWAIGNMLELWRKALPRSQKYKAPLVVWWSRPLLPVQRFPSSEGSNLSQGRSLSNAYNRLSGDHDVIFTHTAKLTLGLTVLHPLLTTVCFSLLSSTLLLSISLNHGHVNTPLLSNHEAWGELCGGKPCPDPGSIRHHWWCIVVV